ncbi:MAG: hypothetical protein ACI82A_003375 [Candidatus Azotimanducaceae bacterium]|jgi:hypothetical protein
MPWTRFDLLLVSLAVLLMVLMIGYRTEQNLYFANAADDVTSKIAQVAEAVETYHDKTNRWFPMGGATNEEILVFPNPFDHDLPEYQGLDKTVLERKGNYGIILQLVRFSPELNNAVPVHLFNVPFQPSDPYLRVLLDYGQINQRETETLKRVQARLPIGSFAEIDDHHYVIDIRRLFNAEG